MKVSSFNIFNIYIMLYTIYSTIKVITSDCSDEDFFSFFHFLLYLFKQVNQLMKEGFDIRIVTASANYVTQWQRKLLKVRRPLS